MRTKYRGENATKMRLKGATKCIYCWEIDHYLKRYCQVFQDNLNSNWIHLGDENKVCLRTYKPGVKLVYMRREKPGCKSVANAEKLRYLSLPPVNVQMLRIGELEPDPYSSNEEIEYIYLDTPIDGIEVLTARINQSQPTNEPSKKPVKQILHWRIEKKKEYAAPKNIRFGEWEPVREKLASAPPIVTLSTALKTAMLDADTTIAKISIEKKNILKLSIS